MPLEENILDPFANLHRHKVHTDICGLLITLLLLGRYRLSTNHRLSWAIDSCKLAGVLEQHGLFLPGTLGHFGQINESIIAFGGNLYFSVGPPTLLLVLELSSRHFITGRGDDKVHVGEPLIVLGRSLFLQSAQRLWYSKPIEPIRSRHDAQSRKRTFTVPV